MAQLLYREEKCLVLYRSAVVFLPAWHQKSTSGRVEMRRGVLDANRRAPLGAIDHVMLRETW